MNKLNNLINDRDSLLQRFNQTFEPAKPFKMQKFLACSAELRNLDQRIYDFSRKWCLGQDVKEKLVELKRSVSTMHYLINIKPYPKYPSLMDRIFSRIFGSKEDKFDPETANFLYITNWAYHDVETLETIYPKQYIKKLLEERKSATTGFCYRGWIDSDIEAILQAYGNPGPKFEGGPPFINQ